MKAMEKVRDEKTAKSLKEYDTAKKIQKRALKLLDDRRLRDA